MEVWCVIIFFGNKNFKSEDISLISGFVDTEMNAYEIPVKLFTSWGGVTLNFPTQVCDEGWSGISGIMKLNA